MGVSYATKTKQSWEEIQDFIEFSGRLAQGDTISLCDVTGWDEDGVTAPSIFSDIAINGTKVYFTYKGGTTEKTYKIQFRATSAGGQKVEEDFFFTVYDY